MTRIISANLNGIRSAWNKGFSDWLSLQKADVVCLQEVKAQAPDLHADMHEPPSFSAHYHFAEKKGYSGTAVFARKPPDRVAAGFGSREFDPEGRLVRADFGTLSVISVYLPSGSSSEERQQAKFRFLVEFMPRLEEGDRCGSGRYRAKEGHVQGGAVAARHRRHGAHGRYGG